MLRIVIHVKKKIGRTLPKSLVDLGNIFFLKAFAVEWNLAVCLRLAKKDVKSLCLGLRPPALGVVGFPHSVRGSGGPEFLFLRALSASRAGLWPSPA